MLLTSVHDVILNVREDITAKIQEKGSEIPPLGLIQIVPGEDFVSLFGCVNPTYDSRDCPGPLPTYLWW